MKKAYFIGIAGKTMGPLAKAFKDMGWSVSGSDHKGVYPPISTYLKENKIPYTEGYKAENVPSDADLIVVGRSSLLIDSENTEYLKALEQKTPVLSYPEVLGKYLIKESSIVVAGTYGKTTISALIAWILINAGEDPSYMIGGIPINMGDGVKITHSKFSVVEGDESPALKETDPPKFMYYRPKYLVLTATKWDHPEIFKTENDYLNAFKELIELLPSDGLLVFNEENVDKKLLESAKCRMVGYSKMNGLQYAKDSMLIGKHNIENIGAAVVLCSNLNIPQEVIEGSIKSFKGLRTRLEFLGKAGGRSLFWDLAQHPAKVKGSLEALRENFPDKKIFCIFDPSMTGLKHRESLSWYKGAFDSADQVILGKVHFLKNIDKEERVTGRDIAGAISTSQKNVLYEPIDEKLVDFLLSKTKTGDVLVFMSSGGLRFTNLIEEIKSKFEK